MNLHKLILTNNDCFKAGQVIKPEGIMVHSSGANNPKLSRYVGPDDGLLGKNRYTNHWNTPRPGNRKVCVHAFIGKLADGTIATYQTLPWNMRGWHAGKANDTHIGFEICEDGLSDPAYFLSVYKEAVELCVYLCKLHGLTERDILCHSEGYKRGIATNHADVMHWFPRHGKSMDTFRADVKARLAPGDKTPDSPVDTPAAFTPYRVRVYVATLNIRKGPGTNFGTWGHFTGKGIFTVVDEATGPGAKKWGLLKAHAKNRNGWIALDFTTKL
jgi:hypothetical protein